MTSEEKAYGEGHNAYHDGNPYKRFSAEWEQWRTGWHDEKHDDPYWEKVKALQKKYRK